MQITVESKTDFFKKAPKEAQEKFNEALAKCCLMVEADAKRNCPVDTGNLRRSIYTEVEDGEGYVGANAEYAVHIEYGTKFMPAQPFLYPALKNNQEKIKEEIKNAIGEIK